MVGIRACVAMALLLVPVANIAAAESIYNQIGRLRGQITIIDHTEIGDLPGAGVYFVLQRLDCRKCLVGVRANVDGRYEVFLGVGTYRIICRESEGDRLDLIRKGQERMVTVKPPPKYTEFNFDLELPNRGDRGHP